MRRFFRNAPWLLTLAIALSACEYNPPPEVELVYPPQGVYLSGTPLVLRFSEPIRQETLELRLWPSRRDVEGRIPPDVQPYFTSCKIGSPNCLDTELAIAADLLEAEVLLDPDGLGQPDLPLILEVVSGLTDLEGYRTAVSSFFDIQFFPPDYFDPVDPTVDRVPFTDGVYVILAIMDRPLPVVLTLITDFVSLDDNRVAMAGAEGDEIGDAPRTTSNAEELMVDSTAEGYTVYASGSLSAADGLRYLAIDPFDISIRTGPMLVSLDGIRLNGMVVEREGNDHIEGTLSYEVVSIQTGDVQFDYDGGSTPFLAQYAEPQDVPEGTPRVCGDLCGAVTGQCFPPNDFPPNGFCEEEDEE